MNQMLSLVTPLPQPAGVFGTATPFARCAPASRAAAACWTRAKLWAEIRATEPPHPPLSARTSATKSSGRSACSSSRTPAPLTKMRMFGRSRFCSSITLKRSPG